MKIRIHILTILVISSMMFVAGCAGSKRGEVVKVVKPKYRFGPYSSIKHKKSKRTKTVRYRTF